MSIIRLFKTIILLLACNTLIAQTCTLTLSRQKLCVGNTATFTVNTTGGTVTNITINYGDGNVNTNAAAISVYSYNTSGIYTPSITVAFAGGATCKANGPTISVNALPIANFVITTEDTMCFKNNNLCISNLSQPGPSNAPLNQLVWQLSNGYLLNTTPVFNQTYCYQNNVDVFGHLYTLVLEVRDTNGCINRMEKQDSVVLLPKRNSPLFTATPQYFCDSTKVNYTNNSNIPLNIIKKFYWLFGDGARDSVNWLSTSHTFLADQSIPSKLVVIDVNNCTDTFSSDSLYYVNKLATGITISPGITQCYRGNKFTFTNNSTIANVRWEVFDKDNIKINDLAAPQLRDYSFADCGRYRVRLTVSLINCSYVLDTFVNVLGPRANIANDTARVQNNNQCLAKDTVYFKTPAPYTSCHFNNPAMRRLWNFGDATAPPCTTDTRNGINIGLNCNFSRDSLQVKHFYPQGVNACYKVSLFMEDLSSGCNHSDTSTVVMGPPKAGYDSTFNPPRPRLFIDTLGPVCANTLITFDIDRTEPTCGYEKAWINFDSACNKNSWVPFDTIRRPRSTQYAYQNTCDPDGWITVGIVIKNGACYDTAWYHRYLRIFPKNPYFKVIDSTRSLKGCAPYYVKLQLYDTIQRNLKRVQWSVGSSGLYGLIDTITQVLEPIDSLIVPQDFMLPGMGAYAVSVTITDIKNCSLTVTGWISAGIFSQAFASRPALCVNDTLKLLDVIRYIKLGLPGGLDTVDYWADPQRAAAGKEQVFWDIGDGNGFSVSGHRPTVKYSKPGLYYIRMMALDSSGCRDTFLFTSPVNVTELKASIGTQQTAWFCAPQIVQFRDSSSIVDSSSLGAEFITNWTWLFGDNKPNSLQKNPAHNFTSNGVYKVKLIATTANLCVDTDEIVIDMKGPQPRFNIVTDTIGCAPFTVRFDNTTQKQLLNWTWFFGDNNVRPITTDSDVVHTYLKPGVYKIRLQGQDTVFNTTTGNMLTCNDFFPDTNTNIPSRTVYVFPSAPVSLNSKDSICPNEEIVFTATADTLYKSFFWQFGDGDTLVTKRPDTIARHTYKAAGTYSMMLAPRTPNSQLCIDTVFKNIFVSGIKADFDVDSSNSPNYRFINKSSANAVRYNWNFGDEASGTNNFSELKNPSHQFQVSKLDTFWVCLRAYNAEDCEDSLCKPVVLGARVRIPNVFTPDNHDNFNDAFDIDIEGWSKYDLVIYNRWGNKVFEGDKDGLGNDGINWNGKVDNTGAPCPAGVYYFIFKYKLITETQPKTVTGTITLIREN